MAGKVFEIIPQNKMVRLRKHLAAPYGEHTSHEEEEEERREQQDCTTWRKERWSRVDNRIWKDDEVELRLQATLTTKIDCSTNMAL